MIHAVIERCAGIDVGKSFLAVCLMTGPASEEPATELRPYGTVVSELEMLSAWLEENGCTHVVMESTGWYWKPVFNLLEEKFTIVLAAAGSPRRALPLSRRCRPRPGVVCLSRRRPPAPALH